MNDQSDEEGKSVDGVNVGLITGSGIRIKMVVLCQGGKIWGKGHIDWVYGGKYGHSPLEKSVRLYKAARVSFSVSTRT